MHVLCVSKSLAIGTGIIVGCDGSSDTGRTRSTGWIVQVVVAVVVIGRDNGRSSDGGDVASGRVGAVVIMFTTILIRKITLRMMMVMVRMTMNDGDGDSVGGDIGGDDA